MMTSSLARNALFDLLEHELHWAPVLRTLHRAVDHSNPHLLPGDDTYEPPILPPEPPKFMHEKRTTWAMRVAYYGPAFKAGYAYHKDAPHESVAGCIDAALRPMLDGRAPRLAVAGRTDAGVSALNQLCSFTSFPELGEADIRQAVECAAPTPGALRVLSADRVPRSFHATFSTRWRRYVYLLPAEELGVTSAELQQQIAPLVGSPYDYSALGRGVPRGKETRCTLLRARASTVVLPFGATDVGEAVAASQPSSAAIRIEIVGDRFLRRMVRTLVASAVWAAQREGAAVGTDTSLEDDTSSGGVLRSNAVVPAASSSLLMRMATSGEQTQTAHPAPARGLVFAGAGGESDTWAA